MAQAADILTKVYTVDGIVYSYGRRGDYQTAEIGDAFNYPGYSHIETLFK
jgi:hypothetical protein